MTSLAQRERAALCDTFDQFGPDAPTLCGSWTTKDLAAHLVVRERRPAALGIVVKAAAGWTQRVQDNLSKEPFERVVGQVRSGPPWWSPFSLPGADSAANTWELFVHHEDVRRAAAAWRERHLSDEEQSELWRLLRRRGRLFLRRSPLTVSVVWPGNDEFLVERDQATGAGPAVVLSGKPTELTMYLHGRQSHALVTVEGDPDEVATFKKLDLAL